ncbi:alginate export family protein [uncultured Halopseudomonas sp.]|uniref:alginate export family protein n=1 Tax=uncultured Halopseudomonas sp. TaxID=2901193 RepID=UPI0030ED1E88|tara:strand:- start:14521 stop:15780 length:1260 start_codon:yes stop_codon:yes gene_type:complete
MKIMTFASTDRDAKRQTGMGGLIKAGIALALMGGCGIAGAQNSSLADAITSGKTTLDLRYRYEWVDQDNPSKNANASTLRTRLNYATGTYQGLAAFIEFDDVSVVGSERYNNATRLPSAETQYSVVADPESTEINQLFLSYAGWPDNLLKFGRQRIIYDNARFIGNVGWRQNEQTYDAFSLVNSALADTQLSYAYIDKVNRIFGDDSPIGEFDMRTHLLNLGYSGWDLGKLSVYGYFLEFVDTPAASNRTLGARFVGDYPLGADSRLLYALEYAKQDDYKDGASNIDADYYLLELGAALGGMSARLGHEVLGVDGSAFSTPLATAHAFNGWADVFLVTPADGLQDSYLKLAGTLSGTGLAAAYHDFSADRGGDNYGSEINLQATRSFGRVNMLAKYARYRADDFAVDTSKFWLMAQVTF